MTRRYSSVVDGKKVCSKCGELKSVDDYFKDKQKAHGLSCACKACSTAQSVAWRKANKDKGHEYCIKSQYGVSYKELFDKHNGKCAICGLAAEDSPKRLCVDHCHETGMVRGLLCDSCNRGIACLKHSSELLANAINYLKES